MTTLTEQERAAVYRRSLRTYLVVLIATVVLFISALGGLFALLAWGVLPGDALPLVYVALLLVVVWLGPRVAKALADRVLRKAGIGL